MNQRDADRRPNIIVVLADDLGWAELGCYGNRFNETPRLDELAKRGVRFTNAYAAAPVCSPFRASFMSGQWPARVGITDYLRPYWPKHLPTELTTIAESLRDSGYATGMLGKWHLTGYRTAGVAKEVLPSDHGFNEVMLSENASIGGGSYFHPYHFNRAVKRRIPPVAEEDRHELPPGAGWDTREFLVDRMNLEAVEFIEQNRDQPFFLYKSHYAVHTALNAPAQRIAKYQRKAGAAKGHTGKPNNVHLAAQLEAIDSGVGMMLDKLAELRLNDNTIVIFMSDNGGESNVTSNAPLRAGKSTLYEGGIRVPLVVHWPGRKQSDATCDVPVCSVDLLPTLLEAAGSSPPQEQTLDGVSFSALLDDAGAKLPRDTLYWHYPLDKPHFLGGRAAGAIRQGDWKLIEFFDTGDVELYNLAQDESETEDLATKEPSRAAALKQKLAAWRKSIGVRAPGDPAPHEKDEDGFVSLFDGKSLSGWHAMPQETAADWSIRELPGEQKDGRAGECVIAGGGSENRLSYLVWRDEDLDDFELKFRYRMLTDGNTGVEIRAVKDSSGKRPYEGYHADLGHVGIGPHILGAWDFHFATRNEPACNRGTQLFISPDDTAASVKITNPLTAADIKKRDWNDVHILARGRHCQLFINGRLSSEFIDDHANARLKRGAIGLQLHDKGMKVEFKDLRLKKLSKSPAAGANKLSPLPQSPAKQSVSKNRERPNVVLIISDDHAWTDYGFQESQRARTPNIDRLAAEGLTFTRGYVTTAICSPSLATMLTGLYPHQHGITGNDPVPGQPRKAWLDRFFKHPQLPQQLADAGYLTLHTGKLWMQQPSRVGFTDDMGPTGRHGGQALAIGRETMEPIHRFIGKAKKEEKPFFVWYAPFLPHRPHNPPERLLQKYTNGKELPPKELAKAKYLAMVEWLDETCGQLMSHLKEQGVDDNTMIIYLADNGWNEYGKAFPYENGVRTPVIIRWPAAVAASTNETHLASNLDMVPTILSACGVEVPQSLPGVNLLDSAAVTKRQELFFANFAHDMASPTAPEESLWTRSCVRGKWKLIIWQDPTPKIRPYNNGDRRKNAGENFELFDLFVDPHETKNLAAEHPDVVKRLRARIDTWWDANSKQR